MIQEYNDANSANAKSCASDKRRERVAARKDDASTNQGGKTKDNGIEVMFQRIVTRTGNGIGAKFQMNRGKNRQEDRGTCDDDALTIAIQRTSGTRGDFSMVLPVRSCGGVTFLARCQGRPRRR